MTAGLIGLGLLCVVIVYAIWTGRRLEKGDQEGEKVNAASEANRIREDVRRLSDDALADELRTYQRPVREPGGDQS